MHTIKRLLLPLGLAAHSFRQPVALISVALLGLATLSAQSITTGDIAGTVKDPSGAIVPGATVTLKSLTRAKPAPRPPLNLASIALPRYVPGITKFLLPAPV